MKFKILFVFILITTFLGSCQPYKSVLEKEKENELITNSIQGNYEIENIYKINKKSTLELNLQEGKKYKFQYFSKWYFDMILLDSQSEIIAMNKISYEDSTYFSKTIIFECKNTGKYNLKLERRNSNKSSLLVVASQNIENQIKNDDEYTFIRNYRIFYKRREDIGYTCVFSKGTKYKFILEKGITKVKLYQNNIKKAITEFYLQPKENEVIFECKETGVYYLKAMNYVKNESAVISLYSNRSDSTKSN